MNDYKKIEGKVYVRIAAFKYLYGAQVYAKKARKAGWKARIFSGDKMYQVYRILYK